MSKKEEVLNMLHWIRIKKVGWRWVNKETWEKVWDIIWWRIKYWMYNHWIDRFKNRLWYEFTFDKNSKIISWSSGGNRRKERFIFKNDRNEILVIVKGVTPLSALVSYRQWEWLVDRLLRFKKLYCPNAVVCNQIMYNKDVYEIDLTD